MVAAVSSRTELVLLGTAAAPMPVAGRGGISSALVVDERVFVIDCGRGSPSAFIDAGLDFRGLEAVFLTHFHADHTGDLPGMLLYPWGVRVGDDGPLPPIRVYGPSRPKELPDGDGAFHRETTIHPELPAPGAKDLVGHIFAGYAYHLNVYLERHGTTCADLERAAALHTDVHEVGGVAERAGVHELILNHYLPAEPGAITDQEWAARAARGFSGVTPAGHDGMRRVLCRGTQGRGL